MVNFWAITKTQTTNRMKSWGEKKLKMGYFSYGT